MSEAKWKYALMLKCPVCGKSNLFKSKHSYDFKNILVMNPKCTNCNEDFEVEPGFYQGAMYMSYIITCAMSIAILPIYIALNFSRQKFLDNAMYYILSCIILLIITAPYVTQLSRAIWLTVHIKYFKDSNKSENE